LLAKERNTLNPTDPQFMYMVLILPGMFGMTMVGEGVTKIVHYQPIGWLHIMVGIIFMGAILGAYLFLSGAL